MSLYLSRLFLNPRSNQVQSELRSPYEMHRTFSKAFGDEPREWESARVLFRVDETGIEVVALVQSKTLPDWSRLSVSSGYLADDPQVKAFNPSVSKGQRLAFRLRANPTVKRDGKRLGLLNEEDQINWLKRKGDASGFHLLQVSIIPEGFIKSRKKEQSDLTLLAVRYDGVLQVTEPDSFLQAVQSGIGSGKAFGFGMLSLAKG